MKWEGGEQSDNVEDRRGIPRAGLAIGGGGGIVLLIIALVLGVDPQKLAGPPGGAANPGNGGEAAPPKNDRTAQFVKTVLRYTEDVWDEQFAKSGSRYEKPKLVLFSDAVSTGGCGNAPSAVGPFYCPADRTVYLDPSFFDELEQKLGGSKAEFSQAYVIAHEIGHHVQNLLGYSAKADAARRLGKREGNEASVRLELQADYLAGVWAHYGQEKFKFIEPGDVESALKSANAIGDDRLQKRSQGWTSPESYTHGTSEQRTKWFRDGLQSGDMTKLRAFFTMPYKDL